MIVCALMRLIQENAVDVLSAQRLGNAPADLTIIIHSAHRLHSTILRRVVMNALESIGGGNRTLDKRLALACD